jgi:hypothetical protein
LGSPNSTSDLKGQSGLSEHVAHTLIEKDKEAAGLASSTGAYGDDDVGRAVGIWHIVVYER